MAIGKERPWIEIAVILIGGFFLATSIYYRNWAGFIMGLFFFTPLVLCYIYYQWKIFLSVSLLFMLVFFAVFHRSETVFLIFIYLICSAIMGELIRKERPVEEITLLSAIPLVLSGVGLWFFQAFKIHADPVSYFHQMILQNLEETIHYYEKIGFDKETIDYLRFSLPDITNRIFYFFPGIYMISLIFIIFLNYLLVRFILIQFKHRLAHFKPLSSWFASDYLVWGLIFSGVLSLIPSVPLKIIGGNLFILFILVYFFQGLALVADFLKRRNIKPFWQAFSYIFLIFSPLLGAMVAILGLFDIWIDFRKVRQVNV